MRYMKTSVVAIAFLATIWFVRTVYAQTADNNGIPAILRTVQSGLAAVQSLRAAVSPATQENVRFTPPLFIEINDTATCDVVNVTGASRIVRIETIDGAGIINNFASNIVVLPGETRSAPFFDPFHNNSVHCKFTVVDGTRTDIRGSISAYNELRTGAGLSNIVYVSLPAE